MWRDDAAETLAAVRFEDKPMKLKDAIAIVRELSAQSQPGDLIPILVIEPVGGGEGVNASIKYTRTPGHKPGHLTHLKTPHRTPDVIESLIYSN